MSVNICIYFNGNCEEAMNFYKSATGGSIDFIQRYGESPVSAGEAYKDKILHARMTINGSMFMFSDSQENNDAVIGNNFSLSTEFGSDEEMQGQFDALSQGGKITMPLQDTFWGAKFGMCTDKFNVNWMFNHQKTQNSN